MYTRRHWLGAAAFWSGLPLVRAAGLQSRLDSRARFKLAADFAAPEFEQVIVPFATTDFQSGADVTLQPGGKVLINTSGLYEVVFSSDWDAKSGNGIDLRQIGIRRQKAGQPDEPVDAHDRLGFSDIPGSDPPRMGRYQGNWAPPRIEQGAMVSIDVTVSPAGIILPGDSASAAHNGIKEGDLPPAALTALMVGAKVIAPDTVRVTLYNPTVAGGINVPPGMLNVLAMSTRFSRGNSGDTWQLVHSPSVELSAGDRVYGMLKHKVPGTLLQATRSSYLQVDRLA